MDGNVFLAAIFAIVLCGTPLQADTLPPLVHVVPDRRVRQPPTPGHMSIMLQFLLFSGLALGGGGRRRDIESGGPKRPRSFWSIRQDSPSMGFYEKRLLLLASLF